MNQAQNLKYLAVLLAAALMAACEPAGELRSDSRRVDPEGAETAEVRVKLGAGTLHLEGGAPALMEATFHYNRPSLEPEVDYSVTNGRGFLEVRHARHFRPGIGRTRNSWDIRLGSSLPTELRVELGAGSGDIDCRSLNLTRLKVEMGVGRMTLDLTHPPARNLDVSLEGGIGSGTIYLPRDVGVRVHVEKGLGSVDAEGLNRSGDIFTNEAYGRTATSLDIDVEAGIGSISLVLRDAGPDIRF